MKITVIGTDDWVVVYKDGVSVWNGHNISGEDMLDVLGIPYKLYQEDLDFDADDYYDVSWFQNTNTSEGQPLDQGDLDRRVDEGLMDSLL